MFPVILHIPVPWFHFRGPGGFYIAQVPLFSYGLMLALSLIVGWYIVLRLCEKDGIDADKAGRMYVWTAACSVAGARLLYVFTNPGTYVNKPWEILALWDGGLVAYGGFIGGFLTAVVASRKRFFDFSLLTWADAVVPSLGTGLMITRIGCLMAGCDFGRPVEAGSAASHWAIRFPLAAAAAASQRRIGILPPDALSSLPVHPTQLYESLIGLLLFGLTMLVRRFRRFTGEMFCAFTIGYGVLRFFVEFLRADEERGEVLGWSTSQLIGLCTALLAAALWVSLYRRWKVDPAAARHWEQPLAPAPAMGSAGGVATNPAGARSRRRRRK